MSRELDSGSDYSSYLALTTSGLALNQAYLQRAAPNFESAGSLSNI